MLKLLRQILFDIDDGVVLRVFRQAAQCLARLLGIGDRQASRPSALKPMTVSAPPITAILSISLTQPFPDDRGLKPGESARQDHSGGRGLVFHGGEISGHMRRTEAAQLGRADVVHERVVAQQLKRR